ncbi:hypothetical protein [Corynebacterium liangguodongii]|uniref:hypothetical protein n=1 Tax=Corynebacterium liangguodongii TaxID=2079535 RepID=UPI0011B1EFF1|nr:hypothetical protein [Corynebacterium liangguodongii]
MSNIDRTITVTLPRPYFSDEWETIFTTHEDVAWENTELERQRTTAVWREEPGTVGIGIGNADFFMLDHEAESVALALLAHARRNT